MATGSRKLSRKSPNRDHLIRNMATSLLLYEKVDTTMPKAKEVKAVVDHLISVGKRGNLASRRSLLAYLFDKNAVKKIDEVLAKRYQERTSGFVRLARLGARLGDGAMMARLELVDREMLPEEVVSDAKVSKVEKPDAEKAAETIEKPKRRVTRAKKTDKIDAKK